MSSLRNILVTGGNSGIGYETVKALLQSDKAYHVFLGARSMDKAKSAVDAIQGECPSASNTVEALQVDLNSDESIEQAFKQVKTSKGHLDTLVNNAGKPSSPHNIALGRTDISQALPSTSSTSAATSPYASPSPSPTT